MNSPSTIFIKKKHRKTRRGARKMETQKERHGKEEGV